MTTQEFSDQFDVLYNNITSNLAPGLNEYEKSVFLTNALDEIVLAYFTQFDKTANIQADFSNLIRTVLMVPMTNSTQIVNYLSFDPRATLYYIPNEYASDLELSYNTSDLGNETAENFDNVLILINEQIILKDHATHALKPNGIRLVIPIPFNEWTILMSKPYKYPNKYQAWRLLEGRYDNGNTPSSSTNLKLRRNVAIILNPADNKTSIDTEYVIRYVKKPRPIVLADFSQDGVTFSSDKMYNTVTECELDPIVHHLILNRAVELAKAAWAVGQNTNKQQLQAALQE